MRTFGSFLLALFASLFASQIVAQQLAVYFKTREEFIGVMMLLFLFALTCIAVLAVAYVAGRSAKTIDRAAGVVASVFILATVALTLFGMSQNEWVVPAPNDWQLLSEIFFPAMLIVAVQWWLVRRRALRSFA